MFKVVNKDTNEQEVVYKVDDFAIGIMFLVYRNDIWKWCSANDFRPIKYPFLIFK